MNYLLDTCVLSEFTRRQPEEKVVAWVGSLPEERLFLSAVTVGEIQHGIQRLPDSTRKSDLLLWLNTGLIERFERRILPLDAQTMLVWGSLIARLEQMGRPAPVMDTLIAATALQQNLILCTRNTGDFTACGVEIFNPWG